MSATERVQLLDFNLIRSDRLNPIERSLLQVIASYSTYCSLRQSDIAKMICRSVPTVKRATKSLIQKGFITKKYTTFKRCVLQIVSLDKQKQLMSGIGAITQIFNYAKSKIKRPDRSPVTDLDRSSASQPTGIKQQEIKLSKSNLNLFKKMTENQFISERDRQIALLKQAYALN